MLCTDAFDAASCFSNSAADITTELVGAVSTVDAGVFIDV